jgi:D-glycero-alpha-D-manno-heptose-7-phosphate kinase
MIISKTPLRIEFLGGSTDIKNFYRRSPGRILNLAIDKFIYVTIHPRFDGRLRLAYEGMEYATHSKEVTHSRTRAALHYFHIPTGLDIASASHVSAQGSGLGASSSFTAGLVNALAAWEGKKFSPLKVAELAAHIEIDKLKEPIGKQDQYAAAFGGFNAYTFNKAGSVKVVPVGLSPKKLSEFMEHMIVFHTGVGHSASGILNDQHKQFQVNFPKLKEMAAQVSPAIQFLEKGDWKSFAEILSYEWEIKQTLSRGITNSQIETMREKAKRAGAWGSRLSGAGGGGYLVVIAPPHKHPTLKRALKGYQVFPVGFSRSGSEIIFSEQA